MPGFGRPARYLAWLAGVAATPMSCRPVSVVLDGRPCSNGRCADGYDCHPMQDRCAPAVAVACAGEGVCPEDIVAGADCDTPGSFIPCELGATGCEEGCRTCTASGHWSQCEFPDERCGADEQCDADELCRNQQCRKSCITRADCLADQVCIDRICEPYRPICGNDEQEEGETCDGPDLDGRGCVGEGFSSGTLTCNDDCTLDTSQCLPIFCGNGLADAGEVCDLQDLREQSCTTLGLGPGNLVCTAECALDPSDCAPAGCGNGVRGGAEECDGSDFTPDTCQSLGFTGGQLTCDRFCRRSIAGCIGCGNERIESGELCDGANLAGLSCEGGLACREDCYLDAAGCTLPSTGTGADGALPVSSAVTLPSPAWAVTALNGDRVQVSTSPAALGPGVEVLLINLQGDSAYCASTGRFELLRVASVAGSEVVFTTPIQRGYGVGGSNADLTGQKVAMFAVFHFSRVEIQNGGVLSGAPWDGAAGGVLVMRVQDELVIASGGRLSVDGLGFRGGAGFNNNYDENGRQGESICGNPQAQSWTPNDGGGGGGERETSGDDCGQGGGGGGFAGAGTAPTFGVDCRDEGYNDPAQNGGTTYGNADFSSLFLGSGGGGGATDNHGDDSGGGGRGGGLAIIFARRVVLNGSISANGANGAVSPTLGDTGNGGGGAGGAVYLSAGTLVGSGSITTAAGLGAPAGSGWNNPGGDGGEGRIRIDYHDAGSYPYGTNEARAYLSDRATPDPGHSALYLH